MSPLGVTVESDGLVVAVLVKPRASRSAIVGSQGEELAVAVRAPPVEGAANDELVRVLAKRLGVARSSVRIVGGHRGRHKRVRIEGLSRDDFLARIDQPH